MDKDIMIMIVKIDKKKAIDLIKTLKKIDIFSDLQKKLKKLKQTLEYA